MIARVWQLKGMRTHNERNENTDNERNENTDNETNENIDNERNENTDNEGNENTDNERNENTDNERNENTGNERNENTDNERNENTDNERCLFCLGKEDIKQILLDFLQTRNWRKKCVNGKWVNISKGVAYREVIRCNNKYQTRNVGRYLDKVKYKWCKKQKKMIFFYFGHLFFYFMI